MIVNNKLKNSKILKEWNSCGVSCEQAEKAFESLGKIGFELKQSRNKKKIDRLP